MSTTTDPTHGPSCGGSDATPAPESPRRRLRVWVIAGVVFSGVVLTLAGVAGSVLVRTSPPWWRQVRSGDPRVAEAALDLENSIVSSLYQMRETDPELAITPDPEGRWRSEDWGFAVDARDANAWLNERMPRWLATEEDAPPWPRELREVQVNFDERRIYAGVKVEQGGRERVVSVRLRPELREDGSLWLSAEWVYVGRLPIPASWVLDEAEARSEALIPASVLEMPQTAEAFRIIRGQIPAAEQPTRSLGEGRVVRLRGMRLRQGRLEVTLRTEQE